MKKTGIGKETKATEQKIPNKYNTLPLQYITGERDLLPIRRKIWKPSAHIDQLENNITY